jgi:hypothetical protein
VKIAIIDRLPFFGQAQQVQAILRIKKRQGADVPAFPKFPSVGYIEFNKLFF